MTGTRSGLVNVTNVAGNKRSALSKSKKPSNGSTTTPKKPLATVRVAAKRLSSGKARPGRKENPAEATAVHDQDDMADDVSSAAGSDYDSDTGNEPAKNPVVKRARQSSSPTDNKTPKKQRLAIPSQFNSASKILSTPGTGKKSGTQGSQTPKTPASVYQEAKAAFRRCATPSRLIGRGKERKAICAFIEHHVLQCSSGALYISGCPGTGKTALLNEVIRTMAPEFGSVSIACANLIRMR